MTKQAKTTTPQADRVVSSKPKQVPETEASLETDLLQRAQKDPTTLRPNEVNQLQRVVGNQATIRIIAPIIQRDDGEETPTTPTGSETPAAGTGTATTGTETATPGTETAAAPPGATVEEPTATSDTPHEAPPGPAHSPVSHAGAQQILTDAFGEVKQIQLGSIQILDQAAFQAAYDGIYTGQYSWANYVVPRYGNLNGFAYNNVNYINSAVAGLHTVVHEMLHNNVAADWRGVVGGRFDEGTTEVLTMEACRRANEYAPICYPGETPVVQEALAQGLSMADLTSAYLTGGAQQKIAAWADANCTENWAAIKTHLEAQDWAAARAGLQRRAPTAEGSGGGG